jgi:hypothetical protein
VDLRLLEQIKPNACLSLRVLEVYPYEIPCFGIAVERIPQKLDCLNPCLGAEIVKSESSKFGRTMA